MPVPPPLAMTRQVSGILFYVFSVSGLLLCYHSAEKAYASFPGAAQQPRMSFDRGSCPFLGGPLVPQS